jgi:hypothetical protein
MMNGPRAETLGYQGETSGSAEGQAANPSQGEVTMTDALPDPGDIVVINTGGQTTTLIQLGEYFSGGGFSEFDHAAVCTQVTYEGGRALIWIAEAEPGGAKECVWHYEGRPHAWSTGILPTSPAVAEAARKYTQPGPWGPAGVPYSWLDYAAIAAHARHIPAPGLQGYIASTHHQICSQLADQARTDGGFHTFSDNRWPGFVRPADLGDLILSAA